MVYTPPSQKKQIRPIITVLFVLSAALYIFSLMYPQNAGIVQTVAFAAAVGAIFIMIRYLYTSFTYEIKTNPTHSSELYGDDIRSIPLSMVDLSVSRKQGQRAGATEVLISMDKLKEAEIKTDTTLSRFREKYSGLKLYTYLISLFESERIAMVFEDDGDNICIVIEPSEDFKKFIFDAVERNKKTACED